MKRRLTKNQRAVLEATYRSISERRMGPSTRELFEATLLYPGVIVSTINSLERWGFVTRASKQSHSYRSLRLTSEGFKVLGVDDPDSLLDRIVAAWDGKTKRSKALFIALMDEARRRKH